MYRTNHQYYRDLAHYIYVCKLFRPVRLSISNVGRVAARNVRVEFSVNSLMQIEMLQKENLPQMPKKQSLGPELNLNRMRFTKTPGNVCINQTTDQLTIEIDCGDLQPGRRIFSDVFYIGKKTENCDNIVGAVYADNLSCPSELNLTISASLSKSSLTVEDLMSWGECDRR